MLEIAKQILQIHLQLLVTMKHIQVVNALKASLTWIKDRHNKHPWQAWQTPVTEAYQTPSSQVACEHLGKTAGQTVWGSNQWGGNKSGVARWWQRVHACPTKEKTRIPSSGEASPSYRRIHSIGFGWQDRSLANYSGPDTWCFTA